MEGINSSPEEKTCVQDDEKAIVNVLPAVPDEKKDGDGDDDGEYLDDAVEYEVLVSADEGKDEEDSHDTCGIHENS